MGRWEQTKLDLCSISGIMLASTGSQWSPINGRVMWVHANWLKRRRAPAFWSICSGFAAHASVHLSVLSMTFMIRG